MATLNHDDTKKDGPIGRNKPTGQEVRSDLDGFKDAFVPEEYLEEYFSQPDDEDLFTARFLASALQALPNGFLALEFGGGPALYSVAALAAKAREIHFCDYVPANLTSVSRWLNDEPGAFDWRAYIQLALEAEGIPVTPEAVLERQAAMRRTVSRLMICDARSRAPLGEDGLQYDLVAAHHCTDVAATSFLEWKQIIRNVSSLVAPAGWLIVSVTTGARTYTVGDRKFVCVDLSPSDVAIGFEEAGYDPTTYCWKAHTVEGDREYSGILMACARKNT